jgi:hypothetical protein
MEKFGDARAKDIAAGGKNHRKTDSSRAEIINRKSVDRTNSSTDAPDARREKSGGVEGGSVFPCQR